VIASLRGQLIRKRPDEIVIDVAGVGYRLFCPLSTFYTLPDEGQPARLHVHTHLRDDALHLFGFATPLELLVFKRLISVGGIGPKLAVNILSGIGPEELVAAVGRSDLARLTAVPGVGKKTAERMIVELKDKLAPLAAAGLAADQPRPAAATDAFQDALSALSNLGYTAVSARRALDRAVAEGGTDLALEDLLRLALKRLAG
jgi:Holliday junction DNA helicase RuvA